MNSESALRTNPGLTTSGCCFGHVTLTTFGLCEDLFVVILKSRIVCDLCTIEEQNGSTHLNKMSNVK